MAQRCRDWVQARLPTAVVGRRRRHCPLVAGQVDGEKHTSTSQTERFPAPVESCCSTDAFYGAFTHMAMTRGRQDPVARPPCHVNLTCRTRVLFAVSQVPLACRRRRRSAMACRRSAMMALSRGRTPSAAMGACLCMAGTTTATATSTASTAGNVDGLSACRGPTRAAQAASAAARSALRRVPRLLLPPPAVPAAAPQARMRA